MPSTNTPAFVGYVARPGRATLWGGSIGSLTREQVITDAPSDVPTPKGALIAGGNVPTVTPPVKPAKIAPGVQSEHYVIPDIAQPQPLDRLQGMVPALAGFVTLNPDWDGVLCCPGRVTHWVHVSAQEIISFQSFSSMEIANAIVAICTDDPWDETAYHAALDECMSRPERVAQILHRARLGASAAEQICGALIGAELAAARPYWLGQQVAVLGPETATEFFTSLYGAAIDAQGLRALRVDEDRMVQAGLETLQRNI